MQTSETTTAPNSTTLFSKLCEQFNLDTKLSSMVTADLRERTGHTTLPNYHTNGATEDDKVRLYAFYLRSIYKKDFSEFKGQIARAQASVEPTADGRKPIKVDPKAVRKPVTPQVAAMPGVTPLGRTELVTQVTLKPEVTEVEPRQIVIEKPAPVLQGMVADSNPFEALVGMIVDAKLAKLEPFETTITDQLIDTIVERVAETKSESVSQKIVDDMVDDAIDLHLATFRTKILGEVKVMLENERKNLAKEIIAGLTEALKP